MSKDCQKMRTKIAPLGLVLLLGTALNACSSAPSEYSAGPTYATVVDAETKQPVEGAVVVAQWKLQGGLEFHGIGVFVARESTTDASGKFHIDGWGPLPRPREGVLDHADPQILVFKSGYRVANLHNYGAPKERIGLAVRDSAHNGSVIELRKVNAEFNRGFTADMMSTLLMHSVERPGCNWKSIPLTLRAVDLELKALGRDAMGRNLLTKSDCGPLEEFRSVYEGSGV
jgi:hypothetical protein